MFVRDFHPRPLQLVYGLESATYACYEDGFQNISAHNITVTKRIANLIDSTLNCHSSLDGFHRNGVVFTIPFATRFDFAPL